ncbi:MAG: homogentisate phytyltransferase [Cyanobacteria bacterium J055]|nr:MAG: homogentisate phytyltransferase [Cyanobacteria bacterium J055]
MGQISTSQPPHPFEGLYSFWKFSRPHTIIGTTLSVWGIFAIATSYHNGGTEFFEGSRLLEAIFAWIACLCGNVYIVGLNQLEDVEIDQINKPHLPLASGDFSRQQGWAIVAITGVLAILISAFQSYWLLGMVAISLLLGTAYSLPPIRLKRFPFWASFCIFTVRGIVVNLGLFLHFNGGFPLIPEVWALTLFVLVFTFAIAIFKDIPDLEGDRQYNITTLTLKLGKESVFNLARWVISSCYLGMAIGGVLWLPSLNLIALVTTHLSVLALFWWRSQRVNLEDKTSIAAGYQFIWKLFFLEYLMFSAICFFGV